MDSISKIKDLSILSTLCLFWFGERGVCSCKIYKKYSKTYRHDQNIHMVLFVYLKTSIYCYGPTILEWSQQSMKYGPEHIYNFWGGRNVTPYYTPNVFNLKKYNPVNLHHFQCKKTAVAILMIINESVQCHHWFFMYPNLFNILLSRI